MNFKSVITAAACGLVLASCQTSGNQQGASTSASDAAKADSLITYFAQLRAAEYDREAQRDTTLATEAAKKAYVMGVQAGLNAAKDNNEAYNTGLFLGMQMAMNFQQFTKDYGIRINRNVFVKSLSETLASDSMINGSEAQREFYRLMGEFNSQKEERDAAAAAENVQTAATQLKLNKISDQLWGTVTETTDGEKIKDDDNLETAITLSYPDGKEIESSFPTKVKVGMRGVPAPLNDAFKSLRNGETGKFVTSAKDLFGSRASQMNLDPSEAVVVTIKATIEPQEEEKK